MGVVDCNDQLLKYSAICRRTVKWWKKVFSRLLNLSVVNSYILYREWMQTKGTNTLKLTSEMNLWS